MAPIVHRFCTAVRTSVTRYAGNLSAAIRSKLNLPPAGFRSQRMCPFCGLITPRGRALCLACGKRLPAMQFV